MTQIPREPGGNHSHINPLCQASAKNSLQLEIILGGDHNPLDPGLARPLPVGIVKVRVISVLGVHPSSLEASTPPCSGYFESSGGFKSDFFSCVLPLQAGGPVPEKVEVLAHGAGAAAGSLPGMLTPCSSGGIYALPHGNSSFASHLGAWEALAGGNTSCPGPSGSWGKGSHQTPELLHISSL